MMIAATATITQIVNRPILFMANSEVCDEESAQLSSNHLP
jgi:hypothetical protein